MLEPGDAIPEARVWTSPREGPLWLTDVLAGGRALVCFYLFDWSPTWTSELRLLRDRRRDFEAAGVAIFGISRDSPWSHAAWAPSIGVDIPLLSDWNGDATRGFGVAADVLGMSDVSGRAAFLVDHGGTVSASWAYAGRELPDVDAILAAARGS
jgi:peroxiredoxin